MANRLILTSLSYKEGGQTFGKTVDGQIKYDMISHLIFDDILSLAIFSTNKFVVHGFAKKD